MTVTVMAPVTAMTVAMGTVHAVSATVAAMTATVATTMPTTVTASRSRGDGSGSQSECCDSCEIDLAKHSVFSIC